MRAIRETQVPAIGDPGYSSINPTPTGFAQIVSDDKIS
jgi:hypothetical protein